MMTKIEKLCSMVCLVSLKTFYTLMKRIAILARSKHKPFRIHFQQHIEVIGVLY